MILNSHSIAAAGTKHAVGIMVVSDIVVKELEEGNASENGRAAGSVGAVCVRKGTKEPGRAVHCMCHLAPCVVTVFCFSGISTEGSEIAS